VRFSKNQVVKETSAQDPKYLVKILRHGDFGTDKMSYFINMELCDFSLAQYIKLGKAVDGLDKLAILEDFSLKL
jgi:hypothetical protein